MKFIWLGFVFSLFSSGSLAQVTRDLKLEKVYLDRTDSSGNCYTAIYPREIPLVGCIFIIPGFGESAERVLEQTDLPLKTARSGLLTIIPSFADGVLSFGVDSSSQTSFMKIIAEVGSRYRIRDLPWYLGGFSIGGSAALKYAENAGAKPNAVFAIDSPLDFERMYNSAMRDVRLSRNIGPTQENLFLIKKLEALTGGSPANYLKNYYSLSPYSYTDLEQTAVKKLINTPVRIYSEPDINWWLKERGLDLTQANITESSAMINELNKLGNSRAAIITTQNKGYRKPDNARHPHSWSIVDNDELIKWLLEQR